MHRLVRVLPGTDPLVRGSRGALAVHAALARRTSARMHSPCTLAPPPCSRSSTTGDSEGAIATPQAPQGSCSSNSQCPAGQGCDSFSTCTRLTTCSPATGQDSSVCLGVCADKCGMRAAELAKLNSQGQCDTDADCGAGLTCAAVSGRTCTKASCSGGVVSKTTCAGFCTKPDSSGPALVSAQLSDDGRQVELTFSTGGARGGAGSSRPCLHPCPSLGTGSPANPSPPSRPPPDVYVWAWNVPSVFDTATTTKLGSQSWLTLGADSPTNTVVLLLDLLATLTPGDTITVQQGARIVDRATFQPSVGGSQPLAAAMDAITPVAVITGPTSVGAGCGGTDSPTITLDASASPPSGGRCAGGHPLLLLRMDASADR